jgi:hypothetical protein
MDSKNWKHIENEIEYEKFIYQTDSTKYYWAIGILWAAIVFTFAGQDNAKIFLGVWGYIIFITIMTIILIWLIKMNGIESEKAKERLYALYRKKDSQD